MKSRGEAGEEKEGRRDAERRRIEARRGRVEEKQSKKER